MFNYTPKNVLQHSYLQKYPERFRRLPKKARPDSWRTGASFYPSKEEAGLLPFGWRFGWAAPCLEFWSLKVASGFLFDDRFAHHALPGSFSFNVLDAASRIPRDPNFIYSIEDCQLRAKTFKKAITDKISTFNSNYYNKLRKVQVDTHDRRQSGTCVPEQCHVTHGVRLMTHFVICHMQLKKLQATIHDLANLL